MLISTCLREVFSDVIPRIRNVFPVASHESIWQDWGTRIITPRSLNPDNRWGERSESSQICVVYVTEHKHTAVWMFKSLSVEYHCTPWKYHFYFYAATASSGPGPPNSRGFTIKCRHTTLARTPLDEWSARRRDPYLTTYNTQTIDIHARDGWMYHTHKNFLLKSHQKSLHCAKQNSSMSPT
jgi:hypothetical protein